jgi:serine/threonine protein kinase
LAPEILLNKGHGKAVDWYTLGIFIYEMLVGYCPYTHDDTMQLFDMILKMKISFPSNDFDADVVDLIKNLT